MRRNILSTLKIGTAYSSKTYKIKEYYNTAHISLNKETVWNKMSLKGIHVLFLQKQISD
jgi:hypothetical protein